MTRTLIATLALASTLALTPRETVGAAFDDDFATDPATRGWFATGTTRLFQWNPTTGALHATWDSREPNSCFARPLGVTLSRTNDFCLVFDLRLADVTPNIDPNKSSAAFQLAVGLIRLADATSPSFLRGAGYCPNLLDFSFFPDPGGPWSDGPTITAVLVDDTSFGWLYEHSLVTLETNETYRVTMAFDAEAETLRTEVWRNGTRFHTLPVTRLPAGFTDFALDHLAVCSYSDAGQFPGWEGSILAHGAVDNVSFAPWLPVKRLTALPVAGGCGLRFDSHAGWLYTLERTTDWRQWQAVTAAQPGTDAPLTLTDPTPPGGNAGYRVRAAKP